MNSLRRLARFVGFTLTEYVRSGRVLAEILAIVIAYYVLFRRAGSAMTPETFFSLAGLVMLGLAFYTTSMMMGLGDRPQGYLVLARKIGRAGYLLGHYLAALAVELVAFGVLSLLTAIFSPVEGLGLGGWMLGSLPLVLNVALTAAAVTLLAPIVLSAGWRLAILAAVAIAFSGSVINSQTLRSLSPLLRNALGTLQVVFSTPLLPVFTGFALSVNRDYSGPSVAIPLAQLSLTLGLLALATYAFARREVVFHG